MKSNSKFKVVIAWSAFLIISLFIIGFVIVNSYNNKVYDEYEDIKSSLKIKDIAGQREESYYVYIYSSSEKYQAWKQEELEKPVMAYFTFAHKNRNDEKVKPIYAYDIDKFKANYEYSSIESYLTELNSNLDVKNAPVLVLVNSGIVSSVYTSVGGSTGIEATLSTAIKGTDSSK